MCGEPCAEQGFFGSGVKAGPKEADALDVSEPEFVPKGPARHRRTQGAGRDGFDPRVGAPVPSGRQGGGEVWFKDSGRVVVAPADARWTFHPDDAEAESVPATAPTPSRDLPPEGGGANQPPRARRLALVGVVVSVVALVTGLLGATHTWPFRPSAPAGASPSHGTGRPADIRGTWQVTEIFSGTSNAETMQIKHEKLSTGAFSGTLVAPLGEETIRGSVTGPTVSFTIAFGTTTISGDATVAGSRGRLSMVGNFSNAIGGRGVFVANRNAP